MLGSHIQREAQWLPFVYHDTGYRRGYARHLGKEQHHDLYHRRPSRRIRSPLTLDKLVFSGSDSLYICGDMIDKGP